GQDGNASERTGLPPSAAKLEGAPALEPAERKGEEEASVRAAALADVFCKKCRRFNRWEFIRFSWFEHSGSKKVSGPFFGRRSIDKCPNVLTGRKRILTPFSRLARRELQPQVQIILFQMADEKIANSEIHAQHHKIVPQGRVRGCERLQHPADQDVNDVGGQGVASERPKDPYVQSADVARQ